MDLFSWIGQEETLTSLALTVRAQTISPNDRGVLLWDVFFPRRNVDSVKLSEIVETDFRPAADRREWNARGRFIPQKMPRTGEVEMVPIEAFFSIKEREVQALKERTFGNMDLFRRIVGVTIPERTDSIVSADYRRIELDAFTSWALNQIQVMNPVSGTEITVAMGVDSTRYQTALTAWNNVGVNGYDEFLAWLEDGIDAVGPIIGVMLRLATFKAIQADAPQGINGVQLTRAQVEDRIQQDLGTNFRFYINENTIDKFLDGGMDTERVKVWAAEKVAAIPQGEAVGNTHFAPVARAVDLSAQAPGAGVDVRGCTVYHETENGGRGLTVEAQVNALPLVDVNRAWVIDAGV